MGGISKLLFSLNDETPCSLNSDPKSDWIKWCDETELEIRQILNNGETDKWTTKQVHLEPVKSFAPRVHHLVLDLKCTPNKKP